MKNNPKFSLQNLEHNLLLKGLEIAKDLSVSNKDCMRMEFVVNEAVEQCQEILVKALLVLNSPELLSLCPEKRINN